MLATWYLRWFTTKLQYLSSFSPLAHILDHILCNEKSKLIKDGERRNVWESITFHNEFLLRRRTQQREKRRRAFNIVTERRCAVVKGNHNHNGLMALIITVRSFGKFQFLVVLVNMETASCRHQFSSSPCFFRYLAAQLSIWIRNYAKSRIGEKSGEIKQMREIMMMIIVVVMMMMMLSKGIMDHVWSVRNMS